jgi:uncharacterized RDD family membrane protein YckC
MPWLLIRRATAYGVDCALLLLVLGPIGLLVLMALGGPPAAPTGPQVWLAAVLNFSVPAWIYFIWSDRSVHGATLGKRLLGLHVVRMTGERVGTGRALVRTAVKLLPWETIHVSAFALATDPGGSFDLGQMIGLTVANGLILVYLSVAAYTHGRRSVHDYVAATEVCRVPDRIKAPQRTGPAGQLAEA